MVGVCPGHRIAKVLKQGCGPRRVINMLDLSTFSTKFGAKFGLTVTVIVLLAACSHKKIESESAELNPIPANAVVQSSDEFASASDAPTPVPSEEVVAAPAKKARHASKARNHKRHASKYKKKS